MSMDGSMSSMKNKYTASKHLNLEIWKVFGNLGEWVGMGDQGGRYVVFPI